MSVKKKFTETIKMGCNSGRRVVVIGGGIGGLSSALAFSKSGAEVHLYEQAQSFEKIGAGVQITPNGARVLEALGLSEDIDQVSVVSQAVMPMDALTGRNICQFSLIDQQPSYRFIHRHHLIGVLVSACKAEGVTLHLGEKVPLFLPCVRSDWPEYLKTADIIVAADGIHSKIRDCLNSGANFFSQQVAWRAIVDRGDHPACAKIWMAPKKHIVTYPLSETELNVVAIEERSSWQEPPKLKGASTNWAHDVTKLEFQSVFSDCCEDIKNILEGVSSVQLWGLFLHSGVDHWHHTNVVLVGDSAHPTLPFLAQGANLALEDAYYLTQTCDHSSDLKNAFLRYQTHRKARVQKVINTALSNGKNYHLSSLRRKFSHFALSMGSLFIPFYFKWRFQWIYNYDVTQERF